MKQKMKLKGFFAMLLALVTIAGTMNLGAMKNVVKAEEMSINMSISYCNDSQTNASSSFNTVQSNVAVSSGSSYKISDLYGISDFSVYAVEPTVDGEKLSFSHWAIFAKMEGSDSVLADNIAKDDIANSEITIPAGCKQIIIKEITDKIPVFVFSGGSPAQASNSGIPAKIDAGMKFNYFLVDNTTKANEIDGKLKTAFAAYESSAEYGSLGYQWSSSDEAKSSTAKFYTLSSSTTIISAVENASKYDITFNVTYLTKMMEEATFTKTYTRDANDVFSLATLSADMRKEATDAADFSDITYTDWEGTHDSITVTRGETVELSANSSVCLINLDVYCAAPDGNEKDTVYSFLADKSTVDTVEKAEIVIKKYLSDNNISVPSYIEVQGVEKPDWDVDIYSAPTAAVNNIFIRVDKGFVYYAVLVYPDKVSYVPLEEEKDTSYITLPSSYKGSTDICWKRVNFHSDDEYFKPGERIDYCVFANKLVKLIQQSYEEATAPKPVETETEAPTEAPQVSEEYENLVKAEEAKEEAKQENVQEVKTAVENIVAGGEAKIEAADGNVSISNDLFAQAGEKDASITLDCGTYSWSFTDLQGTTAELKSARIVTNAYIPDINTTLAGTKSASSTWAISFEHSGDLPGKAVVTLETENRYSTGTTLHFYYYNKELNKFEYLSDAVVGADGKVSVQVYHCSDYIFTADAIPANLVVGGASAQPVNAPIQKSPSTGMGDMVMVYVVLGVAVVTMLSAMAMKKKEN